MALIKKPNIYKVLEKPMGFVEAEGRNRRGG